MSDTSADAFLGGRVTLVQPRRGHRAGLDAALLQAVVPADASGMLADLGAGVGTAAFCVTSRAAAMTAIAVEREPELVACARQALLHPGNAEIAGRLRIAEADIDAGRPGRLASGLQDGSFEWVLTNPPFDDPRRRSAATDALKSGAHLASPGLLERWVRTAAALLRPGGTVGVMHRASELPALLSALGSRFGAIAVLPFHPREGEPAIRILVTARRGSRAPLRLLPGLALHEADGAWSPEIAAVLAGHGDLASRFARGGSPAAVTRTPRGRTGQRGVDGPSSAPMIQSSHV